MDKQSFSSNKQSPVPDGTEQSFSANKIDELLTRGVEKIYPSKESLEAVLRSGKKLRVYQGFDPTAPELHLGHMVGLRKLRQWQDLGHEVIFLIGDFTGMIGDPSGKDKTRVPLTRKQVLENAKTYKEQAGRVLSFEGKNPVKIKFNSEWLDKLSVEDLIRLTSYLTYQQMIERDMFQRRLSKNMDISINEFLYPFMQGYDSVAMDVDAEIGGNDQLFNMMTGRDLMRKIKKKEKFVMTTPLLTDSRGNKIGKTEGNVIALTAPANEFYGMIMNLGDDVIVKCFEYLTDVPMDEVKEIEKKIADGGNPMVYKKKLAFTLTAMLNSEKAALETQEEFEAIYQTRDITWMSSAKSRLPTISLENIAEKGMASGATIAAGTVPTYVPSKSEFKRLENQNAIEVLKAETNEVIRIKEDVRVKIAGGDIIKIGKKINLKVRR